MVALSLRGEKREFSESLQRLGVVQQASVSQGLPLVVLLALEWVLPGEVLVSLVLPAWLLPVLEWRALQEALAAQ
jgi:hypothetical protein